MNVIQLVDSALGDVRVTVDESRCRGLAVQVDALRRPVGKSQHFLVGAEGDDFAVAYRHCFGNRVLRIDRQYPAVKQDQLRRERCLRGACACPTPAQAAAMAAAREKVQRRGRALRLTWAGISYILILCLVVEIEF